MKVSAYYPVVYAVDLDAEAKRYTEDLGFTIRHRIEVKDYRYYVLENNGNRVNLVNSSLPHLPFETGYYGIRVNVDNFEEGLAYFTGLGMKQEGETRETETFLTAVLIGRDGQRVILFQHRKPSETAERE